MSEIAEATKAYEAARNRLAFAAVEQLVLILRGADAAIASQADLTKGTEKLTDVLLAEGWV